MIRRALLVASVSLSVSAPALAAESRVTQEQDGVGNTVFARQMDGYGNVAVQLQEGSYNESSVLQVGSSLRAESRQADHRNWLSVTQAGINSAASVSQTGAYNRASIYQDSAGAGHSQQVTQFGNGNSVNAQQYLGQGSWVTAYQHGPRHALYLRQRFDSNSLQSAQSGFDNLAQVTQEGFHRGTLMQSGLRNEVRLDQVGTFGTVVASIISQSGTDNYAYIEQSASPVGNQVSLRQQGTANSALIDESSFGGSVDFVQRGSANILTAIHSTWGGTIRGLSEGDGNRVSLEQYGQDNALELAQSGDGNLVGSYQGGYQSVATISQAGQANQASLDQSGGLWFESGVSASIVQQGAGNQSSVLQH